MKKFLARCLVLGAAASCINASVVLAADHGDAPGVRLNTRLDINDVYIFQSPATPANTVIVMTTNPLAGTISPTTYHPDGSYEIAVDNDGDSREDLVYVVTFGKPDSTSHQSVKIVRRNIDTRSKRTVGRGETGTTFNLSDGGKAIAGTFDDPFFFDLVAFKNGLSFSSTAKANFFRGMNTNAIVLEVPSTSLNNAADSNVGVWCRTILDGTQIDRMGRPAINTVLVKSANKDAFNKGQPKNDFNRYSTDAIAIIQSLGSTAATAQTLAGVLFPDILTFDTASTSGFLNGRKLADDVIDAELNLLSSGGATTDFVDNDSTFGSTFPYLQAKNP